MEGLDQDQVMDIKVKVEAEVVQVTENVAAEVQSSQRSLTSDHPMDVMNTAFNSGSPASSVTDFAENSEDTEVIAEPIHEVEEEMNVQGPACDEVNDDTSDGQPQDETTQPLEPTLDLTATVSPVDALNTASLAFMKGIFTPGFANQLPKETRIKFGRIMAGPYWPRQRVSMRKGGENSTNESHARKRDSLDRTLEPRGENEYIFICLMDNGRCGYRALSYTDLTGHRQQQHLVVPENADYTTEVGYLRSQKFYKCGKLDFNNEVCHAANLSGSGLVSHMSEKVHAREVEIISPFCSLCLRMFSDRASFMRHNYDKHCSV